MPTGCVPDGRKSAEWECSQHCKPLTDVEIVAIVTLRAAFEGSIEEARQALAECDFGCPLGHYTKLRHDCVVHLNTPLFVTLVILAQYPEDTQSSFYPFCYFKIPG